MLGTVKWFDNRKGYGFIINPDGQDVFVHFSEIQGDGFLTLRDGEKVEYEQAEGERGLHARNVKHLRKPKPRRQKARRSRPPRNQGTPWRHRPLHRSMTCAVGNCRATISRARLIHGPQRSSTTLSAVAMKPRHGHVGEEGGVFGVRAAMTTGVRHDIGSGIDPSQLTKTV